MMPHFTTFKCGHYAAMPPYVTTPEEARNYARWAKGQGLCHACHNARKMSEAYAYARHNCYAELVGSFKQVQWALAIRQEKLKELDLAQRALAAYEQNPERCERLRRAHEKLARSQKAVLWITTRDMSLDELVDTCCGPM